MTEIQAPILQSTLATSSSTQPGTPQPARGYARQVLAKIFSHRSAKIGAVWVGVLVFFAVFAPFVATSHPYLLKQDGKWSSPVLKFLTPGDVILQATFWTTVLMCFLRISVANKIWTILSVIALSSVLSYTLVKPPENIIYDAYRLSTQAGQVQWALRAPIPFSPGDHLRDQSDVRFQPPDRTHWIGTTADASDLLSNMIHATRIALSIGFISTGIAVVIGVIVGGCMGYFSGWFDLIGMRLVEIFDAIPTLLLLLSFVAFFSPKGPEALYIMMAIIGLTSWVGYASFVRAEFLSLRQQDFVLAAKAAGIPLWSILIRHMLPNGITPVIVSASFGVAGAILAESTLSFLGIGLVDEASWGNLLNQALGAGGTFYWWIALFPGLAIFLTVFAYNLIGESVRDALDPKLRGTP